MNVTLAVYSKEVPTVLKQLAWINELGGVSHRTLVLATTPQTNAALLVAEARKGWGHVEHFTIQTNNEVQPWPTGNNANFYAVCEYMNGRRTPFFFMESDVLPLRSSWLDELEAEYRTNAKPFMGDIHGMADVAGNAVAGSEHMNGSGVYPAEVMGYLPTLRYIIMDGALSKSPWDVALRHEIMFLVDRAGGFQIDPSTKHLPEDRQQRIPICHPTQKICFCWRSYDYRVDPQSGLWVCRTEPQIMHRQIDLGTHVLHHGCKDDSLLNLLRERLHSERGLVRAPAAPPMPLPIAPPVSTAPVVEAQPAAVAQERQFKTPMGQAAYNGALIYHKARGETPEQLAKLREDMLDHEQRVLDQAASDEAAQAQAVPPAAKPEPMPPPQPVAAPPAPVAEMQQAPLPPRNPPVIPGGFQTARAALAFTTWKLDAEMLGTPPEDVEAKRQEMLGKERVALDGMFSKPAAPPAPPRVAPREVARKRGGRRATPVKRSPAPAAPPASETTA